MQRLCGECELSVRPCIAVDVHSIGLPPKGRFHMDVDPTQLVLLNQSIHGTFVGGKTDIEAALEYARKGMSDILLSQYR